MVDDIFLLVSVCRWGARNAAKATSSSAPPAKAPSPTQDVAKRTFTPPMGAKGGGSVGRSSDGWRRETLRSWGLGAGGLRGDPF